MRVNQTISIAGAPTCGPLQPNHWSKPKGKYAYAIDPPRALLGMPKRRSANLRIEGKIMPIMHSA